MIQALMVDVDGVVLVHPAPGGWSANLERDLGLSAQTLQALFFKAHFQDVVLGRSGLRERLSPVLASCAPHLSADDLIAYWFEHDYHPDLRLLRDIEALRSGGLAVHLATVQEHERAAYLWETRGLKHSFDALHYAADLGWAKPSGEFFAAIEARTGLSPASIAFIDDRAENVEAACERGWLARLWTGADRLVDLLPELRP